MYTCISLVVAMGYTCGVYVNMLGRFFIISIAKT